MKTISCWDHLRPFGINPLTGEACALMYRILCDITTEGKRVIEKRLSCELRPPENWSAGAIGAVMLAPEMFVPIAVFALLESGCRECWVIGREVVGVEPSDSDETIKTLVALHQ
jgi:hypothetical protein